MTLWRPHPLELLWREEGGGLMVDRPLRRAHDPALPAGDLLLRGMDGAPGAWERTWEPGARPVAVDVYTVRVVPVLLPVALRQQGVPRALEELRDTVRPDAELWLRIHTRLHPGTVRVRELRHVASVGWGGERRTVLTSVTTVEDVRDRPGIRVSVERTDLGAGWREVLSDPSVPTPPKSPEP